MSPGVVVELDFRTSEEGGDLLIELREVHPSKGPGIVSRIEGERDKVGQLTKSVTLQVAAEAVDERFPEGVFSGGFGPEFGEGGLNDGLQVFGGSVGIGFRFDLHFGILQTVQGHW